MENNSDKRNDEKSISSILRIGEVVQKCVCCKEDCDCGAHGPEFIDVEEHKRFVDNIFGILK